MTLFDVFAKREAGDAGLPQQVSDAELLAWGEQIRAVIADAEDGDVIDLRGAPEVGPAPRRPRRAEPLRAAAEPVEQAPVRKAPRRARPLVAPPAAWVDD